jgi:hypothetical protein
MLVRILMLEEYKVPVSRGELDKFVLNVVEDLQNHSKIQHYPGTILKTINGWGNVDGKVYGVMQKVGTALHWAVELKDAKMFADILEVKIVDVNAVNWMGCTALHMAVLNGSIDIVRVLLTCKDRMRLTEQDKGGQTLVQIAHNRGHIDIERALMKCEAVRQYIQELYRDHQVYVDAANAILVGAALIASVTFASWLQPPLSYSLQGYVDVEHNEGLQAFWVFNNLSFYFAIGTVVFGARSVLPRQNIFIKQIVEKLHINLLVTSILLACSVFFVIIAFGIAGSIVLPPILKFQWNMIAPTIIGGLVCVISLAFLFENIWNESPMGNSKRMRFAKYLFDKS